MCKTALLSPVWSVVSVQPQSDFALLITFADGTKKRFNATPLLEKKLYERLKDPAFFRSARAAFGTVVWDDEIDIAPEYLYAHGESLN